MSAREIALAVFLVVGMSLIVYGVSLWSVPAAFVFAGIGFIAGGITFFTEVT